MRSRTKGAGSIPRIPLSSNTNGAISPCDSIEALIEPSSCSRDAAPQLHHDQHHLMLYLTLIGMQEPQ